jgi:hypothetical protein
MTEHSDATGKMVINPQFDGANEFSDGLAAVRIGGYLTGKWGFIDKQGKMAINPQFDQSVDFHAKLTPLFHRKLTPPMAV